MSLIHFVLCALYVFLSPGYKQDFPWENTAEVEVGGSRQKGVRHTTDIYVFFKHLPYSHTGRAVSSCLLSAYPIIVPPHQKDRAGLSST